MAILKYMGLTQEVLLMGTQTFFVLREDELRVSPRFSPIAEEWKQIHDLQVESVAIVNQQDLQDRVRVKLNEGLPLCLPIDIYYLPNTSHQGHLHQPHFVNIFGYAENSFYIVCPYYGFAGWLDSDLIYTGLLSPVIEPKCIIFVPQLTIEVLSLEQVSALVQQSCQYMLGLGVPENFSTAAPQDLGLPGIRTLSTILQKQVANLKVPGPKEFPPLSLSRQIMAVGYSRYWFHQLFQNYQAGLISSDAAAQLQTQFETLTQAWVAAGLRLGAAIHNRRSEIMEYVAFQLEEIHRQEEEAFNFLLGALPNYEGGSL